jgi:RNA polymerase sigma-70 factor (ECF subfamily)
MNTTSATLLERLRQPSEADAWFRFTQLYTPLLFFWCRRRGLQEQDAADLVQEVFATLVQKLPEFRYDRDKGFRNWLRTITLNKWRDRCRRAASRGSAAAESLADVPAPEEAAEFEEAEYRQHLVHRALELMKNEFPPRTWKACWEHVVVGRPAAEVAAELGIAVGSVYVAKSRVLCRLRHELEGLLD